MTDLVILGQIQSYFTKEVNLAISARFRGVADIKHKQDSFPVKMSGQPSLYDKPFARYRQNFGDFG